MKMSNVEREVFAANVIYKIVRKIENLDKEGFYLMTELKNFVEVTNCTTDFEEAVLAGEHFAKKEAYEIREAILERLCDICTKAGSYCWSIEAWYAMAEILKMFGIGPNNNFTSFINFFLAVNIDIKNDSNDTDRTFKISDEIIFIKKLKIIHLLGDPAAGFRDPLKTWQTEQNLF